MFRYKITYTNGDFEMISADSYNNHRKLFGRILITFYKRMVTYDLDVFSIFEDAVEKIEEV